MNYSDFVNIDTALRDLGATPLEIARTLEAGGYKGERAACGDCPIARYLAARTGHSWEIANHAAYSRGVDEIPLPDPVSDFVGLFDHGEYPVLISDETDYAYVLERSEYE